MARSTRLQDYPGGLETTSELFQYIAALLSAGPIADIGDPFWISRYGWVKFFCDFLDHRSINLGKILVNQHDPEDWDFINTDHDYEVGAKPK